MSSHNSKTPSKHLTAVQMQSYRQGIMKEAEMFQAELHLLECEFCRDAMEGFATLEPNDAAFALEDLKQQLGKKIDKNNASRPIIWSLSIAASLLLMISLGLYFLISQIHQPERSIVAKEEKSLLPEKKVKEVNAPPSFKFEKPHQPKENELSPAMDTSIKKSENTPLPETKAKPMNQPEAISEDRSTPLAEKEEGIQMDHSLAVQDEIPLKAFSSKSLSAKKSSSPGEESSNFSSVEMASIKGQILGEDGQPLPGVAVVLKGTTIGTITNAEGNYELNIPNKNSTLVFNSAGFIREEVPVNNYDKVINLQMHPESTALAEVVVTGYSIDSPRELGSGHVLKAMPVKGFREFKEYVKNNTTYPEKAKEKGIEGKVVVEFYVETDGALTGFKIKKSLGVDFDKEAIRIIREGPLWQPGTYNNQPIREQVTVKIPFRK